MIDLKGMSINNSTELKLRIMHLNAQKEEQEEVIKRNVKELYYSLHPGHVLRNAVHDLVKDTELTGDLRKLGINLGTDFIARKFFGQRLSLKTYLSSLVLNRIVHHFSNEYKEVITKGIGKIRSAFGRKTAPASGGTATGQ